MTKRTKKSKSQIAAETTEANEAVAMMAIETIESVDPLSVEIEAVSQEEDALIAIEELIAEEPPVLETPVEAVEAEVHEAPAADEVAPVSEKPAFEEVLASIDDAAVDAGVFAIAKAFDERAAFEEAKNAENTSIQRTLKKARSQMATKQATRVFLACNASVSELNRVKNEGVRYNVYAMGKLGDAINALANGVIANAINNACMRSLFKFRAAGVPFTMEMAKAAASDKIRVDAAVRGLLVRHTVSVSTAPTQASSTMQALTTLGIVTRHGSEKNPTFELTDSPVVARLEAVLSKAA